MQPKKHSEDYMKHSMDSEDGQPAPEAPDERLQKHSMPAGLDYEELGGLSDPGQWDCTQAQNILE